MHRMRASLVLASAAVVGLSLWAGAYVDQTGSRMAVSADRLLKSLDADQSDKIRYAFESEERLNWHFIPRERKGLPIKELKGEQQALAFGLIESGVASSGFLKATTIMSLEAVLREMEQGRGPLRDPERYFLTIFGTPSDRGRWGWRVEGHHLSLNFVLDDGKILAATPAFFGSNPAEVRQGPRQGLRTLVEREDRAIRLLQALDADQRKTATFAEKAPADVRAAHTPQPPTEAPVGIAYSQLNRDQQAMLRALVETYALDMPEEVSRAWLGEVKKAGFDAIHFGWAGTPDRSGGHAYRVQGPTFVIEFNNTQNEANHIHSIWRNMLGDFGIPVASR